MRNKNRSLATRAGVLLIGVIDAGEGALFRVSAFLFFRSPFIPRMPRPSPFLLVLAALAVSPLHAQQAPAPEAAKPAAAPDTVTVPELTELSRAQDGATLKRLVKIALTKVSEIADPVERGCAQGTLDAIIASPADAKQILAAHAIRLKELRDKTPDTIFLTGLTKCKSNDEIVRYARETYAAADKLRDPVLRSTVRFTLARLEDKPGDASVILKAHLKQVGVRFYDAARTSFEANDARGSLESIQIAVRCDPDNVKARFLFAHLLQSALGDTDKAIRTLRVGLEHLSPSTPEAGGYLDRYFQLLESRERDAEVVADASALLGKEGFDDRAREMLAMHLATCLYYVNRCDDALSVITKYGLEKRAQGVLLRARCLFDSRRTDAAARGLEAASGNFQGAERDAILSQLQRFWTDLGKDDLALTVAEQRIREFPNKPTPRVHRLWIYDRMGDSRRFAEETTAIFDRYSEDQGAMVGVANLAAECGMPALATDCFRRARSRTISTSRSSRCL